MTKPAILLLGLMCASVTAIAEEEAGARLFEPCRACHSLDASRTRAARPQSEQPAQAQVGDDGAFDYSPVLRKAREQGLSWDEARLDQFLGDPAAMFPGLWMATRGIEDASDRRALIPFSD